MPSQQKEYGVIIADQQYLVTESLRTLIEEHPRYYIESIPSYMDALNEQLSSSNASLLITDPNLFDYDSLESLKTIAKSTPQLAILILTNQISRTEFYELAKCGIISILYKTAEREELLSALDATVKRKKCYSAEVLDLVIDGDMNSGTDGEGPQLTASEIEIVRLISYGLTTKEIAMRKHISFHTVMTHRKNIFRKLEVNNVSELLMYAMRNGLIDTIEYHI